MGTQTALQLDHRNESSTRLTMQPFWLQQIYSQNKDIGEGKSVRKRQPNQQKDGSFLLFQVNYNSPEDAAT